MENSTAPVYFKPTVAFNRGGTFVFGAWVCTADSAGSFHRHLTMQPNPETGFMTLPEVVTGELAGKFGEISLSTITPTSSSSPLPTRTRRLHGLSHASRLLSHRMWSPTLRAPHARPSQPLQGPHGGSIFVPGRQRART
jgi:hypothetical protein